VPPLHRHDPDPTGVGPHPARPVYGHRAERTAQGAEDRGSAMHLPRELDETIELVLAAMTDRPPRYALARGEILPISARLDDLRLRVRTSTLPGFGRAGWPVGDPDALSNLAILHDRVVQVDAWRKAGPLAPAELDRLEASLGVTLPGPLRRFLTTITAGVPADLHGATWFAAHDWSMPARLRWPGALQRGPVIDSVRTVLHPQGPAEHAVPVDPPGGPRAGPEVLERLVCIYTLDEASGAALPHAYRFVVTEGPWAERVVEVLDFGAVVRVRRDERPLPTWLAEAYLEMLLDAPL